MDKQSPLLFSKSDINDIQFDLSEESEESIMSPGLPSSEALDILKKAIDDGVFEDNKCDNEL